MDQSMFAPNERAVVSYVALRRAIGAIGLALPLVLTLGSFLLFGDGPRSSISSYYYSGMRDVFVGAMCAVGVFLLCYRFGRLDDILGDVGGGAAILLALFPTAPATGATPTQTVVGVVHLVSATVFFLTLAAFCLVLFVRTDPDAAPTPAKLRRNLVYRVCGWTILGCLALALVSGLVLDGPVKETLRPLLLLETLAIVAFGVSWTVKGWDLSLGRGPAPRQGLVAVPDQG